MVLLFGLLLITPLNAAELVNERGVGESCQAFTVQRELKVFKDPTLFLPNLGLIMADPKVGWYRLMQENPLLMVLTGRVKLTKLGEAREFKNFGAIARLYELAEPRLRLVDPDAPKQRLVKIVPVQVCGEGVLGFVLEADLQKATDGLGTSKGLPPSVYPNPIPDLRKSEGGTARF